MGNTDSEPFLKHIDLSREEIISFTQKLIDIPTINPPGTHYESCVQLIETLLKSCGLKTKRVLVNGYSEKFPRINLLGEWNNNKKTTLHLNGHYDVVPVTSHWTKDPFKSTVTGGKLYGRGSGDMKAGLSMILFAIKAIKDTKTMPHCNVSVSFTPDEETGGQAGVEYLIKNNLIHADAAIVTEPTHRNVIHFAHKGVLWLEVTVLGKSAHASMPTQGVNAFEEMIKLGSIIQTSALALKETKSKYSTFLEERATPTLVMGGVTSGGSKINTVPDKIMFTIDRRILPDEDMHLVKKQLLDLITNSGIKTEIKVTLEAEPALTNPDEDISKVLANSIKRITHKTAEFKMASGFMDMRFFVNQAKTPCIVFGTEGTNYHGDDEYVHIDDLITSTKILAKTIVDFR